MKPPSYWRVVADLYGFIFSSLLLYIGALFVWDWLREIVGAIL